MTGLPQMPDTSGLDPDQLQQMLALVSMGGMGPMMPPPMPGGGFPGAGPPAFDPAMAQVYSQMLQSYFQQNLQQQLGTPNIGMPSAFPGQMPQQSLALPEPTVKVSVEGMKFQYQLTEDDIHKVFCRYGKVTSVSVDEACSSAMVTFSTMQDAQAAISDLDGKVLNGLDGTLRIQWMGQPPNPPSYMGMNPGMSLPGFPQSPSNPFGFGVSNLPGVPSSSPPNMGMGDGGRMGAKGRKFTCRFLIGIENDKEFQVARRLIGSKGSNMKKIVQQTEAKLRLRGVGSGYFEGSSQKESSEPLQLCISCCKMEGYKTAVRLAEELLKRVYEEYRQFCHENSLPMPDLQISLSENPVMTTPRGGMSGLQVDSPQQPYGMPAQLDSSERKERRGGAKAKSKKGGDRGGSASGEGDRGTPGPNAPTPEEITRFINDRNEARRSCNFAEADRIRELLHTRGVALMDEPGARGKGQDVTTWRYWHD